jgi:hypothetical protein
MGLDLVLKLLIQTTVRSRANPYPFIDDLLKLTRLAGGSQKLVQEADSGRDNVLARYTDDRINAMVQQHVQKQLVLASIPNRIFSMIRVFVNDIFHGQKLTYKVTEQTRFVTLQQQFRDELFHSATSKHRKVNFVMFWIDSPTNVQKVHGLSSYVLQPGNDYIVYRTFTIHEDVGAKLSCMCTLSESLLGPDM